VGWAAFLALAGSVAWRHPNVYLEFSGIAPPYLDPELIRYLNNPILADKGLFGT
jgi:predicted TIM-barrel fold metal-dependent hydrolase